MATDPRELAKRQKPVSGSVEDYMMPEDDPDAPSEEDVQRFSDVTVKCPECDEVFTPPKLKKKGYDPKKEETYKVGANETTDETEMNKTRHAGAAQDDAPVAGISCGGTLVTVEEAVAQLR